MGATLRPPALDKALGSNHLAGYDHRILEDLELHPRNLDRYQEWPSCLFQAIILGINVLSMLVFNGVIFNLFCCRRLMHYSLINSIHLMQQDIQEMEE